MREVDLPIDIHEFEHVEQEDRAAAIGRGDEIGERGGAGDARIDLAEIDFARIGIDQEVHAEGALVARLVEPVAELLGHADDGLALLLEAADEDVIAAPAALVGRHLGEAGDVGLQRPDQRAMARRHRLDRARQMVDPPHHLELFLGEHFLVLLPVGLRLDEEGGAAGIAIGRLHHQVVAQLGLGGELHQLVVGLCLAERIGRALDAGLVAELRGDDLRIDMLAQLGRRQRDLEAELLGERSVSSSNMTSSMRPPRSAMWSRTSLWRRR